VLRQLRSLTARGSCGALLVVAAGSSSIACQGDSRGRSTEAAVSQPIVYGRLSPPGTREDAIVLLRTEIDAAELFCSGALVAPNLVATARHCIAYSVPEPALCTPEGELVDDGSGAGYLGMHLPADSVEVYSTVDSEPTLVARGARVLSTLGPTLCLDDLGFVVLDRELELPVLSLRLDGRAQPGEAVALSGYGLDEELNLDTPLTGLVRRTKDDLTVVDVGPAVADELAAVPPRTVMIQAPAGCIGDSGGPLYSFETGALLGVFSLLHGSSCTSSAGVNLFAHVPDYPSLIEDAFEAAGQSPISESDLRAVGRNCSSDEQCQTGVCRPFEDGEEGCTLLCERSRDCPDDFECASAGHCVPLDSANTDGTGAAGAAGQGADAADSGGSTRRSSGGCSVSRIPRPSPAPFAVAWVGLCLLWRAKRAQRRPSSGSSSEGSAAGA